MKELNSKQQEIYRLQKEMFELKKKSRIENLTKQKEAYQKKILRYQELLDGTLESLNKETERQFPTIEQFFRSKSSEADQSSETSLSSPVSPDLL